MDFDSSIHSLMNQINDGIYFVDRDRTIRFWNKAAENITGFSAEEVIGKKCSDNILNHVDGNGKHLCISHCPLAHTMENEINIEAEVFLHHKDGHRVPVLVRTSAYYNDNQECVGGVELFTDISNFSVHQERVKELEKLAMVDTLTEVANRYYLTQKLEASFEEMRRYELPFGVLFFDIDHFKDFNDTYGHDVGDRVLKLVSRTVNRNLRPFDLFGRWGGEEFLAIIRNVSPEDLSDVAERFRKLIENSFLMVNGSTQLHVTVSVGATMCKTTDTPGTIQKRADGLMYQSKNNGRNRVTVG